MNRRLFIQGSTAAVALSLLRVPLHTVAANRSLATRTLSASLFVSPSGDDSADGSHTTPLRTLSEAVQRIEEATLPVEMESFSIIADGLAAILRWTTASETNNAGFAVEHRKGNAWHDICFVEGHGTTARSHTYGARIEHLTPGRHQFRLRQVDYDGRITLSAEVEVAIEGELKLRVTPNPAHDVVRISGLAAGDTAFLFDMAGRHILTAVSEGGPITLDIASLARGQYLLKAKHTSQILIIL